MDSLSHGLVGLAVGALRRPDGGPERGLRPSATDRAVFWCTLFASELPDIDILLLPAGGLSHILYHRGFTHSLPAALVLTTLLTLLARWRWPGAQSLPVFGWSLSALLVGHLLLDVVTSFGTQLLLPLSSQRLALDWTADTEPLLVLPLILAVLAGMRWPQRRRRALMAGLALALGFLVWRGAFHTYLVHRVAATYTEEHAVQAVTVRPVPWALLRYDYVVETPARIYLGDVPPDGIPREQRRFVRLPENDPVVAAASRDPRIRQILGFARHPLVTYWEDDAGYDLFIIDFRGGLAFTFRAFLNEQMQVLRAFRDFSGTTLMPQGP